ncbi:MAG: hypothetical protein ABRQ25_17815 [Clostridiaceae bacterium]
MKSLDGDERLEYLRNKIAKEEHLSDEDIVNLTFMPLMRSKEDKSTRTIQCIDMANNIKDKTNKNKCTILLYALFDKFGDIESKEKFMEVISMTEIGKMIFEQGEESGKLKERLKF